MGEHRGYRNEDIKEVVLGNVLKGLKKVIGKITFTESFWINYSEYGVYHHIFIITSEKTVDNTFWTVEMHYQTCYKKKTWQKETKCKWSWNNSLSSKFAFKWLTRFVFVKKTLGYDVVITMLPTWSFNHCLH